MDGLLRVSLFLSLIFTTNVFAQAEDCISNTDLTEIAQDFSQFQTYLNGSSEYCSADLGDKWFKIANSLVVLKNTIPDEPAVNSDDAFTYKAISEKDWWSYFTKRASRFIIQNNCPENVVAYVQPFFGSGRINLCDLFFDISVSSQASTMMHEVRHFDGHGHVQCTQGNEKGISGACDARITGKGSYAISVQTLVGLARSNGTEEGEKSLLESEAVYMAFNKFNIVPKVKLEDAIFLSNSFGEVYRWVVGKTAELITTLDEPAVVINSASNLTMYPLNADSDAYRTNNKFTTTVENPGLYAKHYNAETVDQRELYRSISYFGTGGLLKANTLTTFCKKDTGELHTMSLNNQGQFSRIITLSSDSQDLKRESYLVSETGELVRYECASNNSTSINFSKSNMKISTGATDIVESFGLAGDQYAVLEDGTLVKLSLNNNIFDSQSVNLPINNQDWVSATPLSRPEVF